MPKDNKPILLYFHDIDEPIDFQKEGKRLIEVGKRILDELKRAKGDA